MAGEQDDGSVHYGGYGVTLDAKDRAKNNPEALSGYAIDIRPEEKWPGLAADGGTLHFDAEGMTAVANTLQELHDLVRSVPGQLPPPNISYGPSSWAEAGQLREAGRIITDAINEYSSTLIANLASAQRDIAASAARNEAAEDAADDGARSSGTGIGGA